ncbi:MAG: hypothetical protein H0U67_06290 [Gemmatimonadetes bacterium]|nr:hypothetical protein [Gemmatimonadota bacterium]
MVTLLLQGAIAALILGCGFVALGICRRHGNPPTLSIEGWRLTAAALLIAGSVAAVQASFAGLSVYLGASSTIYQQYIRWAPAANLSRSWLMLAFGALLLALFASGGSRKVPRIAAPVLFLGALIGLVMGGVEGPLTAARHFPRVVVLDLVELIVLGAVLLAGLVRSMDRLLWSFIVLYVVRLALNILWMAARAWVDTPGIWVPSARGRVMISAAFWAAMLTVAGYRLLLARRGIHPEALTLDPQPETHTR